MQLLGEISRAGVTPAELGARLHVKVQSLTDQLNELESRAGRPAPRRDRRRQLVEITAEGTTLLESDRAERDAWLHDTMRERSRRWNSTC